MRALTIAAVAIATVLTGNAQAQTRHFSSEENAVWNVITRSWADEVARNGRWPGNYVHDRVLAWDSSWPSPRDRSSMEKWSRFQDQQRQTLQYELFPEAIAMSGDTAVVHYSGVMVSQRGQDNPERETFGAVETLVRSGGAWKFLTITGFETGGDGD